MSTFRSLFLPAFFFSFPSFLLTQSAVSAERRRRPSSLGFLKMEGSSHATGQTPQNRDSDGPVDSTGSRKRTYAGQALRSSGEKRLQAKIRKRRQRAKTVRAKQALVFPRPQDEQPLVSSSEDEAPGPSRLQLTPLQQMPPSPARGPESDNEDLTGTPR